MSHLYELVCIVKLLKPRDPKINLQVFKLFDSTHHALKAKVEDFIVNQQWHFLAFFENHFQDIVVQIRDEVLPMSLDEDQMVWCPSSFGELTFQEVFLFLQRYLPQHAQCKITWRKIVPISRSFLFGRWIYGKLPTNDNLLVRGCIIVSRCNLCGLSMVTLNHLFLTCPWVNDIWTWLRSMLQRSINISSPLSLLKVADSTSSKQVRDVLVVVVINTVWFIWISKNQPAFSRNLFLNQALLIGLQRL